MTEPKAEPRYRERLIGASRTALTLDWRRVGNKTVRLRAGADVPTVARAVIGFGPECDGLTAGVISPVLINRTFMCLIAI